MGFRFTASARRVLDRAQQEARLLGYAAVEPCHVLLALLHHPEGAVRAWCSTRSDDVAGLRPVLRKKIGPAAGIVPPGRLPLDAGSTELLAAAHVHATSLRHPFTGPEHLLLAVAETLEASHPEIWELVGVSSERLWTQLTKLVADLPPAQPSPLARVLSAGLRPAPRRVQRSQATRLATDRFLTDLTWLTSFGFLWTPMGRASEVGRMIAILSMDRRSGPAIVAHAGYGRDALLWCLAAQLGKGDLHAGVRSRRLAILEFDLACCEFDSRDSWRRRMEGLVARVGAMGDTVLVFPFRRDCLAPEDLRLAARLIDLAAGHARVRCIPVVPSPAAWETLKSALACPEVFEPMNVPSLSSRVTRETLDRLAPGFGLHHLVRYGPAALDACVKKAAQVRSHRRLEDVALDLLDAAGALARQSAPAPATAQARWEQLHECDQRYLRHLANNEYEQLASSLAELSQAWNLLLQFAESKRGALEVAEVRAADFAAAAEALGLSPTRRQRPRKKS